MNAPQSDPDSATMEAWLRAYASERCERAFAKLVTAYGGMVYASAWRRTGDPQMAEEVCQDVFALLAQKATQLRHHPSLAGWLYTTTRRKCQEARRSERRKQARLKHLEAMNTLDDTQRALDPLMPDLDEALDTLKPIDRDILLWHYVDEYPYEEIAKRLHRSPAACRKRASRAIEKLSCLLRKRGVVASAAALHGVFTAELGKATPAGLSSNLVSLAGVKAGSTLTLTASQTFTHLSLMKLKALTIATASALVPFVLPWTLGVGLSLGGLYLSGPAVHRGPESIVVELAESRETRSDRDHQAAVDAAYAKLFAQALSAKGPEATKRVIEAGLALYEAEPEGLWRIYARAPLTDRQKLYGLRNFGHHGAVVATDALRRGYLVEDPQAQMAGFSLIEMASQEDPEGFMRWFEKLAEESDHANSYILPSFSTTLLERLPAARQERYLQIMERAYVSKREREEPVTIGDLNPAIASIHYLDDDTGERMMRAVLPTLPAMTEEAFAFFQGFLKSYTPQSDAIVEVLDRGTSRGEALHHTLTKEATPPYSVFREVAQSGDLPSAVNDLLRDRPLNEPNRTTRFDYHLASAILEENSDPARVFSQLHEIDPAWRDDLAHHLVSTWARHDVVAASAALAQATSVPDSAIAALVDEIVQDPEGARAWASQIHDAALRAKTLAKLP